LYADFPVYTHNNGKAEVSEAPIFASVVHYYAALRGLNTQEIATALGWPQENAKQILNSLEQPAYIQHCIDVCRYLGIPHRLRESALQRAGGYQVDESSLPELDETQAKIYLKQGYMLTPEEMAQLHLHFKEHWIYEAQREPLDHETFRTYEKALEVMRFFMCTDWQVVRQHKSDGRSLPNLDLRPRFEGLEEWLQHLESDLKYAIWERRDQLLYIAYHFYELGTTLWNRKAKLGMPRLDSPLALHYKTKALWAAKQLGNITFIMKTLLDRAEIYHTQGRYQQALQDVRDAVRYRVIEYRTLRPSASRYNLIPYDDKIDTISELAARSDGRLKDEFNKLYKRALSIRQQAETREQADLTLDNDFGMEDLADERVASDTEDSAGSEDTCAFEDWQDDNEYEEAEEEIGWYRRGRNVLKKEETESDQHVFPLGSASDALLQRLVNRYVYPHEREYDDAYGAMKGVLGKGKEQRDVAIDLLLAGLNHKKHEVRAKSALMLSELHVSEAVDSLIEALTDEDGRVRWCAASALGNLQDKRAVQPLINLLTCADSKARLKIAIQRDRHVEQQRQRYSTSKSEYWANESKVRICAAEALGTLKDVRAVKPLITLLQSGEGKEYQQAYAAQKDEESALLIEHEDALRCQVIKALGELGDARAIEPLGMMLLEEGESAANALDALQRIRNPQVLPTLIAALDRRPSLHDSLSDITADIIQESNEQQREDAIGLLLAALSSPVQDTRLGAVKVLGKLHEASTVTPLIALLQDPDRNMRSQAISALATFPDEQVVEALIARLNVEEQAERRQVAAALGQLGDTRAVEPLIACLAIEDDRLRETAIQGLGSLGDQRAIEPLKKLIEHDQPGDIKPYAFRALCQLHDEETYKLLLPMLKKTKSEDKLAWIVQAVDEFRDPQAIKPLLRLVHTARHLYMCNKAVRAIQKIGGKQAVTALSQIVKDGHDWSHNKLSNLRYDDRNSLLATCCRSLQDLGDPEAVEALFLLIGENYSYGDKEKVRKYAIEALATFNDPRTLTPFITLLQEEVITRSKEHFLLIDWKLLGLVITALGELGDPAALPVLQQLSRFTGEDFFDLPHESRAEYRIYTIGEKTLTAIERLTQKSVVTEEEQHKQLQQVLWEV
jgi:HEAT repeat protein